MSSSRSQDQRITSDEHGMTKYTHLHVICLRLEGNFVYCITTVDICEYCLAYQTQADVYILIYRQIANDFSRRQLSLWSSE